MDTSEALARIKTVADAAAAVDGAAPLDEATWMALRDRPDEAAVREEDGGVAVVIDGDLTLVVEPSRRRRGIGRRLLQTVLAELGASAELVAWSHGNHPGAAALASGHGFERIRDLWVLRRSAHAPLPALSVPETITLRSFRPGDEEDIVRVNAAAFASHPEQGAMDLANLRQRMAETWFDPAGLLVAERDGALVGFHWTKRHSPEVGEVYVVGIDPAAQGGGLGTLLTLAGLHHLVDGGARELLLYVESDNAPAVAVYTRLGFTHAEADTHVQWARGLSSALP